MRLGVDGNTNSPFCRQFQSLEELTSTGIAHRPKDNETDDCDDIDPGIVVADIDEIVDTDETVANNDNGVSNVGNFVVAINTDTDDDDAIDDVNE